MQVTPRPGRVFYLSLVLLVAFVVVGVTMPDALGVWSARALHFTTLHFGWLYLFATTGFLIFCIGLAFSSHGAVRLGDDDEEPEFPFLSWLGMIFSAGMGVGLVFWGVAEPLSHYNEPPMQQAEPRSASAAALALRYSAFHWGFHQWANFAVVGLAIAYIRFRRLRAGLISETFRPSLGDRVDGGWGHAINILAVVSTVFGVATTLGLGALQINSGMSALVDMPFGLTPQLAILGGTGLVFMICALTPLEKGIRYISDINLWLAGGLLVFVLLAGPTPFITAAMTRTVGDYLANVLGMSLVMTPFTGGDWVERWTIFYWAWGLSWAPFVGSFIARISRGRTIREFVLGVMVVPVALSILWFSVFGGTALNFELFKDAGIADAVAREISAGLFVMLDLLPGGIVPGLAALLLVVLFVVTSANSATFVLGMFSMRGVLDPQRYVRFLWGVLQLLVAAVLLLSGGLQALQTISILAAFPFMLLMVFMAASLYRGLNDERRWRREAEKLRQQRLERLLLEVSESQDSE